MNITAALRPFPAQPKASGQTARKPEVEGWEVEDKVYRSTADLLDGLGSEREVAAKYHFKTALDEHSSAAGRVAWGAVVGGIAGVVGGALLGFVASVGAVASSAMFYGGSAAPVASIVAGSAGVGAAAGALGGAELPDDHVIRGTISTHRDANGQMQAVFKPSGAEEKVDLNSYASAQVAPRPAAPKASLWQDVKEGAALGATAAGLSVFGFGIGQVAMLGGANRLGRLAGRGEAGEALGLLAGVASFAAMATLGQVGLAGAAIAAAGLAGAGALLGPTVLPKVREGQALEKSYQGQWWWDHCPSN